MTLRVQDRIKSLAIVLVYVLICQYALPLAHAQEPPPAGLNIVIIEGEGATDNARHHISREPIIRVEDDNHKPIAGAAVVFTLPTEGTTGVFANGSQTLIVTTNSNGLAVGKGMRVNLVSGKLVVHVSASYRGLTARTTINQTNEGVAGVKSSSGGHSKLVVILVVVAAAAGGGAYYFATHKSGSSTSSSTTPSSPSSTAISLTPGSGIIIGPH